MATRLHAHEKPEFHESWVVRIQLIYVWSTKMRECPDMVMDQYLYIPFLGGWRSIYQLFWCELQGDRVLTHPQMGHTRKSCGVTDRRMIFTMENLLVFPKRSDNYRRVYHVWSHMACMYKSIKDIKVKRTEQIISKKQTKSLTNQLSNYLTI